MCEGHVLAEVRFTALLEGELEIGEQVGLIGFDSAQVMGLPLEEMARQLSLGQQGIGGEGFAGDIERRDERDEGADLIGLSALSMMFGTRHFKAGEDKAHQGNPVAAPTCDIPQRLTNLG